MALISWQNILWTDSRVQSWLNATSSGNLTRSQLEDLLNIYNLTIVNFETTLPVLNKNNSRAYIEVYPGTRLKLQDISYNSSQSNYIHQIKTRYGSSVSGPFTANNEGEISISESGEWSSLFLYLNDFGIGYIPYLWTDENDQTRYLKDLTIDLLSPKIVLDDDIKTGDIRVTNLSNTEIRGTNVGSWNNFPCRGEWIFNLTANSLSSQYANSYRHNMPAFLLNYTEHIGVAVNPTKMSEQQEGNFNFKYPIHYQTWNYSQNTNKQAFMFGNQWDFIPYLLFNNMEKLITDDDNNCELLINRTDDSKNIHSIIKEEGITVAAHRGIRINYLGNIQSFSLNDDDQIVIYCRNTPNYTINRIQWTNTQEGSSTNGLHAYAGIRGDSSLVETYFYKLWFNSDDNCSIKFDFTSMKIKQSKLEWGAIRINNSADITVSYYENGYWHTDSNFDNSRFWEEASDNILYTNIITTHPKKTLQLYSINKSDAITFGLNYIKNHSYNLVQGNLCKLVFSNYQTLIYTTNFFSENINDYNNLTCISSAPSVIFDCKNNSNPAQSNRWTYLSYHIPLIVNNGVLPASTMHLLQQGNTGTTPYNDSYSGERHSYRASLNTSIAIAATFYGTISLSPSSSTYSTAGWGAILWRKEN